MSAYTYRDLVELCILSRASEGDRLGEYQIEAPEFNAALRRYYKGLLVHLERALGVEVSGSPLDFPDPHKRPIFILFQKTVESYFSSRSPWSYFLEASLISLRLSENADLSREIDKISERISWLVEQSRKAHLEMLFTLFVALYGDLQKLVTSEDLLFLGFDDSAKPMIADFLSTST